MGIAVGACFISTLLLDPAAFAQDETPPTTTPADDAVESAADGAVESATDEASAVQESGVETDKPRGEELEDLASQTEEPFEVEPIQREDIEEILILGEAGTGIPETAPISVIGFDMDTLSKEGIKDIRGLSNFTPSLEIKSAFAASNPTIYIRGVGLDDFNANAAGAVAVYQDGVNMLSPAGQLFQFYDVERVEVLRGPQGTLYRNASAGAILLHSSPPSDEFGSSVTTTYGNYDLWEVAGHLTGPIVPDYLSGRVSGTWSIRDGITKNRCAARASETDLSRITYPCNHATGTEKRFVDPTLDSRTNDVDYWAARGQLLLNLPLGQTETQWLLNVHGGQNRSRAFQYQHRGVIVVGLEEIPTNIGEFDNNNYKDFPDSDGNDDFVGDYDVDGPENIDLFGTNLEGIWTFGGGDFELRSLTAYEWNDLYRLENTDGGARFGLTTEYANDSWQVSQELELKGLIEESDYGDGNWTLGVFYAQWDLNVENFSDQNGPADLNQAYTQELWNAAVYGQLEYDLQLGCEPVSCDFTLLAGLRYNWEHKDFDTTVMETPVQGQVRSTLMGEDDAVWSDWSGDFSVAWNFAEDSNVYAKYSKGWKGGHFNGGAVSVFDIVTGIQPEIVDSYEGGLRSNLFDHRLNLNLTGFYYDYTDLQVFVIEQTPLGYPITKLASANSATVYGLELDMRAEPIEGMRVTVNAAWVESEYDEFVVTFSERFVFPRQRGEPPPDPRFIILQRKFDYTGNTLIGSPNFSATGSIEYDIPLPGEIAGRGLGTLTPRFSFSWKDELLYDACGGRGNRCNFEPGFFGQDPFWIFNAALTWTTENETFTLTGFVHNFMDEHYKSQSFDYSQGLGVIADAYANPRMYGITATFAY